MGFMKKGTCVTPVRQVGLQEWGMTKTAAASNLEEQERLKAQQQQNRQK
jgi:hypothetical protein